MGGEPCSGAVGFVRPGSRGQKTQVLAEGHRKWDWRRRWPRGATFPAGVLAAGGNKPECSPPGRASAATRDYPAFLWLAWSSGSQQTQSPAVKFCLKQHEASFIVTLIPRV